MLLCWVPSVTGHTSFPGRVRVRAQRRAAVGVRLQRAAVQVNQAGSGAETKYRLQTPEKAGKARGSLQNQRLGPNHVTAHGKRLPETAPHFPLALQSSGPALHPSSCLTTREGSLAPSPGLPPSPAGPLARQPVDRDVPCTCYVTRTSPRGLIPPAPELAQRSPGWSAPGKGTAAAGESPEHLQQGRKSRCRTGGLLSPRGVPVPVTVSRCSCSVGHRKGLGKLGLKRHQDKEPRARPGRERRKLSWLRSHRTGLAELLLAGWSHRAAPLLPGAFPASPCCTL